MPFDYEYWRDESRDDWRRLGLHWHAYASRMDGSAYADEAARRDLVTDLAPQSVRDWLRKPAQSLRQVATTPEDAVSWLRQQWEPIKAQAGQEAVRIPEETRFALALYELRCGNDLCWGFWLGASVHLHLALVGTADDCHPRSR
jgi:hypothetical protein